MVLGREKPVPLTYRGAVPEMVEEDDRLTRVHLENGHYA